MINYDELIKYINECNDHYREILNFETKKLALVTADDVEGIYKMINQEQAYVMKSNAFEKRRFQLLVDEKDKNFSQIIDEAPENYKRRLRNGHRELSRLVLQIKKVNSDAQEIVAHRLRVMSSIKNGFVNSYNNDGTTQRSDTVSILNQDI